MVQRFLLCADNLTGRTLSVYLNSARQAVPRSLSLTVKKYRYITWRYERTSGCYLVCACMCMYVRMYYGLTLWCCMMAVDFRLADIFSLPGCPLCSPLSEKYLPRRSLSACPPLSSCLSILRSSVCFSLLLTSHRRRHGDNHEEHKGEGGAGGGVRESDNDRRMHAVTHSLSRPYRCRRFLFCLLSSLPPGRLPPARGTILLSRRENEVFSSATGTSRVNFLGVSCFVSVPLFLPRSRSLSFFIPHARAHDCTPSHLALANFKLSPRAQYTAHGGATKVPR